MFKSTPFDDINKAAYDVLKDGYCLDCKMCLKSSFKNNKVSLEGKSLSNSVMGKLTFDISGRKYVQKKKMSIDTKGVFINETDIGNLVKNTTFMIRNQRDFANKVALKKTIGIKYMNETIATDFVYDLLAKAYSTSITYFNGPMLYGCRIKGDREQRVASIDPCICYRNEDLTFSMGATNYFTNIRSALIAEPFVNVQVAATMDLPLEGKKPSLAFGFCLKPSRDTETRIKVDDKGIVSLCYKSVIAKNTTFVLTVATPLDLSNKSESKIGFNMEMSL